MARKLTDGDIRDLLNNVTPGTARARLGDIIVDLMDENTALQSLVDDLLGRVAALEEAAAG